MEPIDSSSGGGKVKPGSFQSMNLSKEILSGISRLGYKQPTPVQRKALPVALAGMDIVVMSRTGSGKTCVFLVPLLQKILCHDGKKGVRAIILSPTR
jgi:ATP-dependent RNA helicase DDX54/DBP10